MLNSRLKIFFLNFIYRSKAVLAFTIIALLFFSACGKRKPPLPPVEKTQPKAVLSALQQGNKVKLTWEIPNVDASSANKLDIDQANVYRLAEPVSSQASITEEDFASRSTLIATLTVTENNLSSKQMSYTDILEFAGQAIKLHYAVRFVNKAGQKTAFSNFLVVEPTARVSAPPTLLPGDVSQAAIFIKWQSPKANVDGSQPANILGFNLYRIKKGDPVSRKLNAAPVSKNEFADNNFEFESEYSYFVRAVSLGANGLPIESQDSNSIEIKPKDTFAPEPPSAVTIAATPNTISIFFAANLEKDIAGYRIFRTFDPDLPKVEWENLTPELLKTNTFQDKKVESGKTYYYYLQAIDKFKNASLPSEIVSETVP